MADIIIIDKEREKTEENEREREREIGKEWTKWDRCQIWVSVAFAVVCV